MKLARIALALSLILIVATLTGCDKIYSYSFKAEQALDGWFMEDYFAMVMSPTPAVSGYSTFVPNGLYMDGKAVSCPNRFSGDFTYEVVFHLYADTNHWVNFGLNMADGTWYGTGESEMHIEFFDVGSEIEGWQIIEHGADAMVTPTYWVTSPLASLRRNGRNAFRLVKTGDGVKAYMNGSLFADFTIEGYESEWFAPCIVGRKPPIIMSVPGPSVIDLSFGFVVESVRVTYPEDGVSPILLPV